MFRIRLGIVLISIMIMAFALSIHIVFIRKLGRPDRKSASKNYELFFLKYSVSLQLSALSFRTSSHLTKQNFFAKRYSYKATETSVVQSSVQNCIARTGHAGRENSCIQLCRA
jgi:hypothetical protein